MTAHLLMIDIGPVQNFIAAARRSRDLWYGSHLLSELSRCVAREVAAGGGELIFPALRHGDPELAPCLTPLRPDTRKPPVNIANIILAEIPASKAPQELAQKVRKELQTFWATEAERVKLRCKDLIAPGIDAAWDEQIASFLEFSAAWTPLNNYADARKAVAKAIAARKNLRDFEPWKNLRGRDGGMGVPKSSLDGARETVLRKSKKDDDEPIRDKDLVTKYRIGEGEQLDAVGLVKRAGGDPEQFVPLINIALAPWLIEVKHAAPNEFGKLETACKDVKLAIIARSDLPCGHPFRFDASIFLENRLWPTFKEQGLLAQGDWTSFTKAQEDDWKKKVQEEWGAPNLEPLFKALRNKGGVRESPYPYVACLVADGDSMGATIDKLAGENNALKAHQEFSAKLAGFAEAAREIVEQHLGSLVYSGGDDVLAFLPLSEALACANALREKFEEIMKEACFGINEKERPTLSVGLGVGHVLEGMGDLLKLGRDAEKLAKGGQLPKTQRRNALAILVDKRSGGTLSWRARWDNNPAKRLAEDADLLRDELATRKLFEIAETLRRFPKPDADPGGIWPEILADEVNRSLKRAEGGSGALTPADVGLSLSGATYKDRHKAVSDWIARLSVAKTFAKGKPS